MKLFLYTKGYDIYNDEITSWISIFDTEKGAREHIKKEIAYSKKEAKKYGMEPGITEKSFTLIKGEKIEI